ncbi:MAG TPA: hypothetical protein VHP33_11300 [Polyangiaceae bacterium]|nr:hypothetical protein [Polyangiaceae bacterium]
MTDRSVSWTDAESIARLLARATLPRRPTPLASRSSLAARARSAPLPARSAEPAPRPSTPAPAPVPAPAAAPAPPVVVAVPKLEHTSDNPSDRLDALLAWTLDHQRCTGAFIADYNGLTLAAHGVSEAHVALVGPLLSALVAVRSIPGIDATAGALWLGVNMMSWVEAPTERGGFCLGTVGPEALSTEALEQLKQALQATVRDI